MGETVYNRILFHVIRSPIFHQLFYSFFFRVAFFGRDKRSAVFFLLYKMYKGVFSFSSSSIFLYYI